MQIILAIFIKMSIIILNIPTVLHITLQVSDVFLRPIRKTRSVLRAQKTVVEQNTAEGVSPNDVLRNPNRQNRAVSSYRLLGEVFFAFTTFI